MKLVGVELVRVDVPFRQPIGTAAGIHRTRSTPLLSVWWSEEGEGWGECAALSEGTSVDPTLEDVDDACGQQRRSSTPQCQRRSVGPTPLGDRSGARCSAVRPSTASWHGATFEMAVADLELPPAGGQSLAAALEIERRLRHPGCRGGSWHSRPAHDVGILLQSRWPAPWPRERPGSASRSSLVGTSTRWTPCGPTHPDPGPASRCQRRLHPGRRRASGPDGRRQHLVH